MQHARNSTGALARAALAAGVRPSGAGPAGTDAMLAAVRGIGQVGVPENYGQVKDGPGTKFLGTPANHRELMEKRPLSPDVFDIDGSSTHYKFPVVALSSITNRVTGCVLSGAVAFGGTLAAVGGPEALPAFIEGFKSTAPFLVFPAKALVGFPFVYHTLGGFRHIVWDKTTNGIDNASAKASSIGLFAASGAVTAALASYTF